MGIFPRHFPSANSGDPARKVKFYAGIGYANWCAWQSGSVVGILFASQIPQSWGVGFAGTLALLAILIPAVINLPALFGVAAAALVSIVLIDLPYRLGLLAAVAAGMAAAMLIDAWLARRGGQA